MTAAPRAAQCEVYCAGPPAYCCPTGADCENGGCRCAWALRGDGAPCSADRAVMFAALFVAVSVAATLLLWYVLCPQCMRRAVTCGRARPPRAVAPPRRAPQRHRAQSPAAVGAPQDPPPSYQQAEQERRAEEYVRRVMAAAHNYAARRERAQRAGAVTDLEPGAYGFPGDEFVVEELESAV